eukprot:g8239.t1
MLTASPRAPASYQAVQRAIVDTVSDPEHFPGVRGEVPLTYLALGDMVRSLNREHGDALPYLRWADFAQRAERWTAGLSDKDVLIRATRFMHDRGVLLHYDDHGDDLRDFVFILPSWLVTAMRLIVRHNIGEGAAFTRFAANSRCAHEGCGVSVAAKVSRRHCRACGASFCRHHCSQRATLPEFGPRRAVRVCDTCARELRSARGSATEDDVRTAVQRLKAFGELPHWLLPRLWQSLRLQKRDTATGQVDNSAVNALRGIMEQSSVMWPLHEGRDDGRHMSAAPYSFVPALLPAERPPGAAWPKDALAHRKRGRFGVTRVITLGRRYEFGGARVLPAGFVAELLVRCQQWAAKSGADKPVLWRTGAVMTLLRETGGGADDFSSSAALLDDDEEILVRVEADMERYSVLVEARVPDQGDGRVHDPAGVWSSIFQPLDAMVQSCREDWPGMGRDLRVFLRCPFCTGDQPPGEFRETDVGTPRARRCPVDSSHQISTAHHVRCVSAQRRQQRARGGSGGVALSAAPKARRPVERHAAVAKAAPAGRALPAMPPGKKWHAFASHSKSAGERTPALVRHFEALLRVKGLKVFFDMDDLATITLDTLKEEIVVSVVFLVFLDEQTFDSEWCREEIKIAHEHGVPIYTIIDRERYPREHWKSSLAVHGVEGESILKMWKAKLGYYPGSFAGEGSHQVIWYGSDKVTHDAALQNVEKLLRGGVQRKPVASSHSERELSVQAPAPPPAAAAVERAPAAAVEQAPAALRAGPAPATTLPAAPPAATAALPSAGAPAPATALGAPAKAAVPLPWDLAPLPARIEASDGERVRQLMQDMVPPESRAPRGSIQEFYPKVLITYATGGRPGVDAPGTGPGMYYALWLAMLLQERSVDCFSGLCVPAGTDWRMFIDKLGGRFSECTHLIVVHTDALYDSRPCLQEIFTAVDNDRQILPVLFDAAQRLFKPREQWPRIKRTDGDGKKWLFEVQRVFGALNSLPAPPETAQQQPQVL